MNRRNFFTGLTAFLLFPNLKMQFKKQKPKIRHEIRGIYGKNFVEYVVTFGGGGRNRVIY